MVSLSCILSSWRIARVRAVVLLVALNVWAVHALGQTWNLAWHDEFDGPVGGAIDNTRWQFEHGDLKVNNELQFYCAPSDPAPCDVSGPNAYVDGAGHLVIQARRVTTATAPSSNAWTSARMNTANNLASFQYGRIEARMQLPVGPGLWPAFWSLGTNIGRVDWPACGEMDFMENVPQSGGLGPRTVKSTVHGPGYSGSQGIGKDYSFTTGGDVTSMRTYGAIWSPYMVQFYVDDPANAFFILTERDIPHGTQWVYNHPFFLVLNLAVGGTGSWPGPPDETTPSPARMLVDYVRVYKAKRIEPPQIVAPDGLTLRRGATVSSSLELSGRVGSGRAYLRCETNVPKSTCQVSTGDGLNDGVVDFTSAATARATVRITTASASSAKGERMSGSEGRAAGKYSIVITVYNVSSDAGDNSTYRTITIPVKVE